MEREFQEWRMVWPKTYYGKKTAIGIDIHTIKESSKYIGRRIQVSGTVTAIMEDEYCIKVFETATWRGKEKIDSIWRRWKKK